MRSLSKSEWAFLAIVIVYSFIPAILSLVRITELLGAPPIVPPNPRAVIDPVPIILHILGSSVFCLAGVVQFLPSLRRDRPAFHRGLGRVVVATGSISALTGLWMTVFYVFPDALQGPVLFWARVSLSLAMFAFLVWAVIAIRARNVAAHRAAMLRSYAVRPRGLDTDGAPHSGNGMFRCRAVIPPFLRGLGRRIYAAIFSFWAGVMPPMPMLGRSLL